MTLVETECHHLDSRVRPKEQCSLWGGPWRDTWGPVLFLFHNEPFQFHCSSNPDQPVSTCPCNPEAGMGRRGRGCVQEGTPLPAVEGSTEQSLFLQAPLLFNGCRSGEIFAIDLRCRNQGKGWKATRLFHDSAVTSVQILQEEQCLMASDMAGTVG